jgi:hypothetical protein
MSTCIYIWSAKQPKECAIHILNSSFMSLLQYEKRLRKSLHMHDVCHQTNHVYIHIHIYGVINILIKMVLQS